MTDQTVTFTPKSELRKGFHCLAKGIALVACSLLKIYNNSVHRYPYAHIVLILLSAVIVSFVNIANARSERDVLNKKNYQLQQQLDSVMNENEARGGATAYAH